jgi:rhodanese-related sulfurtransferase
MRRLLNRCLVFSVCLAIGLVAALPARGLTVAELQKALAGGAHLTVIDVRSVTLFQLGHIPGAINIPAALCAQKHLPPLGRVVVCDAGLGGEGAATAALALSSKPGITAEVLAGGFAAWESAQAPTTRRAGLRPELPNYITYARLKAAKSEDYVLVDLRSPPPAAVATSAASKVSVAAPALTDLSVEFPGAHITTSPFSTAASSKAASSSAAPPPLLVLIDNGDGKAQAMARALKAGGVRRYVILAGGELTLARHGEAGLKREGSHPLSSKSASAPGGATQ